MATSTNDFRKFGNGFLSDIITWIESDLGVEVPVGFISNREAERFGREFLDNIIEWITDELSPEEVYPGDAVEEWALSEGWVPLEE